MLGPTGSGLVVAGDAFFWAAFKDGDVEVGGIEMENVDEIFPGIVDGFAFEVVAEAPIAQHLEHGVVIGVVAYFLEVVVLTAHAQALLRVGATARFRVGRAENDVFPLVHTGVGEHQCGVVFNHHRSRGNDFVASLLEESLVGFAYFVRCHHLVSYDFLLVVVVFMGAKVRYFFRIAVLLQWTMGKESLVAMGTWPDCHSARVDCLSLLVDSQFSIVNSESLTVNDQLKKWCSRRTETSSCIIRLRR